MVLRRRNPTSDKGENFAAFLRGLGALVRGGGKERKDGILAPFDVHGSLKEGVPVHARKVPLVQIAHVGYGIQESSLQHHICVLVQKRILYNTPAINRRGLI